MNPQQLARSARFPAHRSPDDAVSPSVAWTGLGLLTLALGLACSAPRPSDLEEPAFGDSGSNGASAQGVAPQRPELVAWMARAEELRGLPFRRPVEVKPLVRSEIAGMVRNEIESILPPADAAAYQDAYVALGALPPDVNLVEILAQIYGAQMVGRYSRREGALYLLEGESAGGYARQTIAVHELVHALQDQHHPHAMKLSERLRHNDDLVLALAAAIEGDATFTMFGSDGADPEMDRTLATAERFRDSMLAELRLNVGPLGKAPLLLRVSVIFPYAFGTTAAARRYAEAGNAGLDTFLREAPLATRDVVYAEPGGGPAPVAFVRFPEATVQRLLAEQGCRPGHHNVAGSLTLEVLFDRFAEGESGGLERAWRGDRFLHARCGGGHELIWLTVWEDEAAAGRFVERYGAIAPAVAANAPLSGEPRAMRDGAIVVVTTPRMIELGRRILGEARIRRYASFGRWYAEGCFGEDGGCPEGRDPGGTASPSLDRIDGNVANP